MCDKAALVVLLNASCKRRCALHAGRHVHETKDRGRTVPGDACMEVPAARLACADCQQLGYILDGFPHTAAQV